MTPTTLMLILMIAILVGEVLGFTALTIYYTRGRRLICKLRGHQYQTERYHYDAKYCWREARELPEAEWDPLRPRPPAVSLDVFLSTAAYDAAMAAAQQKMMKARARQVQEEAEFQAALGRRHATAPALRCDHPEDLVEPPPYDGVTLYKSNEVLCRGCGQVVEVDYDQ